MNKEQEDLIATGLWLLIKASDKISTSQKQVWMYDYDKLFGEEDAESTLSAPSETKGELNLKPKDI